MLLSQNYEKQLDAVVQKMAEMEKLLTSQRQRSTTLEGQLSAAQDRIGGAERRAPQLEVENTRIQGEIKYWNDLYAHDTGEAPPSTTWNTPISNPPAISAAP